MNLLLGMLKIDLKSYGSRSEIENAFKEVIKNKNVRLFILKNINRTEDDRYEWKINVSSLSRNLDNIFAEIKSDKQYEGLWFCVQSYLSLGEYRFRPVFSGAEPGTASGIHLDPPSPGGQL